MGIVVATWVLDPTGAHVPPQVPPRGDREQGNDRAMTGPWDQQLCWGRGRPMWGHWAGLSPPPHMLQVRGDGFAPLPAAPHPLTWQPRGTRVPWEAGLSFVTDWADGTKAWGAWRAGVTTAAGEAHASWRATLAFQTHGALEWTEEGKGLSTADWTLPTDPPHLPQGMSQCRTAVRGANTVPTSMSTPKARASDPSNGLDAQEGSTLPHRTLLSPLHPHNEDTPHMHGLSPM